MGRKGFLLGIVLVAILCSGCWDVDEINKRATVLAFGFDATPEGQLRVSAQIPVMLEIGSRVAGGGISAKPFRVFTGDSKTTFGATPYLQTKSGKSLFFGQLKVIVISAALAEEGLKSAIDFLARHPMIPPQATILLTKGSAHEIIATPIGAQEIPSLMIVNFQRSTSKGDLAYPMELWRFEKAVTVGREDAFLPFIALDREGEGYTIEGAGVFHRDRLVGELTDIETRMFGLLSGRVSNAYPSISVAEFGELTFRNVTADSKIRALVSGEEIEFFIKVRAGGFLVEVTTGKHDFKVSDIELIREKAEKTIKNELVKTMEHLQSLGSDVLGFGNILRATHPEIWRRINWEEEYPKVRVRIDFKFQVSRIGTYR